MQGRGRRVARAVLSLGLVASCTPLGCERPEQRSAETPTGASEVTIPAPAATGDPEPAAAKAAEPCAQSFERAWPRLQEALHERQFDGLISPELGVFVTDNPGAVVVPRHFESVQEAAEQVPALRAEHYAFDCPKLEPGTRPHYSCEDDSWSKEGCWHTPRPDYRVADYYDAAVRYDLLDPGSADEREPAREVDALIEHGVYSTDATLGFYFGRLDCRWWLFAIDAVVPCSA